MRRVRFRVPHSRPSDVKSLKEGERGSGVSTKTTCKFKLLIIRSHTHVGSSSRSTREKVIVIRYKVLYVLYLCHHVKIFNIYFFICI